MEKDLLYGKIITFKYPRLSTKDIILKLYHLVKEKNAFQKTKRAKKTT